MVKHVLVLMILASSYSAHASTKLGRVGKSEFIALSQAESRDLLSQSDSFTSAMTTFDRQLRSKNRALDSEAEFLAFAGQSALGWTTSELSKLTLLVSEFERAAKQFSLPLPDQVFVIKSNGTEEFGKPYTRRNAIVFPASLLTDKRINLDFTFAHEVFHVAAATSADFRRQMNELIGYQQSQSIEKFSSDRWSTVVNPDAIDSSYFLKVLRDGVEENVQPVFVSLQKSTFLLAQESPFENFSLKLLLLKPNLTIARDGQGEAIIVDPATTNFHEVVGYNTEYNIHPDETMADNFALLMHSRRLPESLVRIPSPGILDSMLGNGYFLNHKVSTFKDLVAQRTGLSQEDFLDVFTKIKSFYSPFIREAYNKTLEFNLDWNSAQLTANANGCSSTNRQSSTFELLFHGGLARIPVMTKDAYAGIVCHELGHCIGGAPVRVTTGRSGSVSVELQADYFSTSKCLRNYFGLEGSANLKWVESHTVHPLVQQSCGRVFSQPIDAAICVRSSMTALQLARILEFDIPVDRASPPVSFTTPSTKTVPQTERYYADPQCRLDTLFQGALCDKDSRALTSDSDETVGYCNRSEGYSLGVRPLCWHAPGSAVLQQGQTAY